MNTVKQYHMAAFADSGRRRVRFSLRSAALVVTLFAMACGWFAWQRRCYIAERDAAQYLTKRLGATWHGASEEPRWAWAQLMHGRAYAPLNSVFICDQRLDSEAWRQLQNLRHLRSIAIQNCTFATTTDFEMSRLSTLEDISMVETRLTSQQVEDLTNRPGLSRLVLTGSGNVSVPAFDAIVTMRELQQLDLSHNELPQARLHTLAQLTQLEDLALNGCEVDDDSIMFISRLSKLRVLELSGTVISDAGLARIGQLDSLRMLALADTEITDSGLEYLSTLKQLYALDLKGTKLTDGAVKPLLKIPSLQWAYLRLPDEGISTEARERIRRGLRRQP